MNDIEKTTIQRVNSGKRMRRRRRFMSVYALVVLLLVVFAGALASLTFLFKVNEIIISGESDTYTYMEVVDAAGIRAGDNLIRMDTSINEQSIEDSLLFVEEAKVDRVFPSTIKIHVSQCIPAFNVEFLKGGSSSGDDAETEVNKKKDGGVMQVSRGGKILGINDFYVDALPTIYGFDITPETFGKGMVMQSSEPEKQKVFDQLIERFDKWDGSDIVYIDMTDPYEIEICYRSGIIFRMGDFTDVQYKLDLAENVMQDESVKGKKGYLTMIGTNQCSFRMTDEPAEASEKIEPPPVQATDAAGNNVTTTTDVIYRPPTFVTTAAPQEQYPVQTTPAQDQGWNNTWDGNVWNGGQDQWNNGQNQWSGENYGQNGYTDQWGQNGQQQWGDTSGQQTPWQSQGYQSADDWVNNRPAVGVEPDEGYFDENGNFHYWWP